MGELELLPERRKAFGLAGAASLAGSSNSAGGVDGDPLCPPRGLTSKSVS